MCAIALALIAIRAEAQTGPAVPATRTIRGTVRDATTRAPLVAAQVGAVRGTMVVFTEVDGRFVLEGIAAGPVQVEIVALGHERGLFDVAADQETLDATLAPSTGDPIAIDISGCVLPLPPPRVMHRWELLSGVRVGGGLLTGEHAGGAFDLGLRAEVTYAGRSWRAPSRIGPFVALTSTNVDSLEPMAGLISYGRKQRILENSRYEGAGAWLLAISGGYAFQRDARAQDAPVVSVETGYAFVVDRRVDRSVCPAGVAGAATWNHGGDGVCDVGTRFPSAVRLYVNARVYTVDDPRWVVTLGVELEPFASWSALAHGLGM